MVSGRTIASASRDFGNNWQSQPRTILSTARNGTRLGLPRRSTMICCRNTRISASNAARGRNRSTTIPKIILQRSNIPQKIIRFCVSRQPDGICDRDNTVLLTTIPYSGRGCRSLGWMEHQAQGSIIRSRRRNYLSISGYKTEKWSVLNSHRPFGGINLFHHRIGFEPR